MKRILAVLALTIFAVTLLAVGFDTTEAVVVNNSDQKTVAWTGPDYTSEVTISLNDSVTDARTGESLYWFDTSLNWYSVSLDGYTATVNVNVTGNELTDILQSPTLLSGKLETLKDVNYMDSKLTLDNLSLVTSDLSDIPVSRVRGRILDKPAQLTVGNTYDFTLSLEQTTASTRSATIKLGRDSFEITVNTYQNWIDNTAMLENIQIEALNTGYILLDNDNDAPAGSSEFENFGDNFRLGDTMLQEAHVDTNYGSTVYVQMGNDSGATDYYAMYLFDTTGIPSTATIDNAYFWILYRANNGSPTAEIYLTDNRDWNENVITWNLFDNNKSASLDSEYMDSTDYENFNVTSGVQTCVTNGDYSSFVLIQPTKNNNLRWLAEGDGTANRAYLEVHYTTVADNLYENVGEWGSVAWDLHVYSTIDNIIVFSGDDLRLSSDASSVLSSPYGLEYVGTPDFHYYVTDSDTDNIYQFDTNYNYIGEIDLVATGEVKGVLFNQNYWYVVDDTSNEIDNYDTSWALQSSYSVAGQTTSPLDVEFYAGKYYVLSGTVGTNYVYRYDSNFNYEGLYNLGGVGEILSLEHDGNYWYMIYDENINDVSGFGQRFIQRYDNSFSIVDNFKTVSAYDISPRNVLIDDNDNIVFVGAGTDTIYVFSDDNEVDNIYYKIGVDIDNDETIDNLYGWYLLSENGVISYPSFVPDAYCYSIQFKLETSNNSWSPRVSSYHFNADYAREWTSCENWLDNMKPNAYDWTSCENWAGVWDIGFSTEPLMDLDNLMINVILPLLILYIPAFAMMRQMGTTGFVVGLGVGVMMSYIAFGMNLGMVILSIVTIGILWLRSDK